MDRKLVNIKIKVTFVNYNYIYIIFYSWNSLWIELFTKDNVSNDITVLVCGSIEFVVSMLVGYLLKIKLPTLYKLSNNEYKYTSI